jgi:hypothetical protein
MELEQMYIPDLNFPEFEGINNEAELFESSVQGMWKR